MSEFARYFILNLPVVHAANEGLGKMVTIESGFAKTGIYPWDPDTVMRRVPDTYPAPKPDSTPKPCPQLLADFSKT